MSRKVKVRLKITGLELEFEGTQEDVPQITQNLGRDIAGLITAGPNLASGQIHAAPVNVDNGAPASSGRKSPGKGRKSASKEEKKSLNWTYDGQLYGMPSQNWSGNDKAIWMLYVADKVNGLKHMGAAQISKTFNEHYQAAKIIHRGNVYTGLDGLRAGEDAPIGKRHDGSFFLTQEGHKLAEQLIADLAKPEPTA
jgi:hypothetical protein